MQTVKTLKSRSQDGLKQLLTLGKERPETIKTWGVTAGAAVAGGLAMSAGAPGLVAIFTSLASLPVSLMVAELQRVAKMEFFEQPTTLLANPLTDQHAKQLKQSLTLFDSVETSAKSSGMGNNLRGK